MADQGMAERDSGRGAPESRIYGSEFWMEEWNAQQGPSRRPDSPYRQSRLWDRRAQEYGRGDGEHWEERRKRTIERLIGKGILKEGVRILDVGCGPGNYAVPFAEQGARVVALDFSAAMIERLEKEVPSGLATRIEARVVDWKEIDLDEERFRGAFDLVFANMTPAASAPEPFLKLNDASRDWCLNTGWAGKRVNVLEEELWERLTGRKRRRFSSDVIFAFNLLYSRGYLPEIDFQEVRWEREMSVIEGIDYFAESLGGELDIAEAELRRRIGDCLGEMAVNGMVTRRMEGLTGQMLWQVGKTR